MTMKAKISILGEIGKDVTLLDVVTQFKAYENATEAEVRIKSYGGNSEEGDKIHDYLQGLKPEVEIITITGLAYSAACKIFAAGGIRKIEDKDKAAMIHNPAIANLTGDAKKFEIAAEKLREVEGEFAVFYSALMNVEKETVSDLLSGTTYMSGKEAVAMGLATELIESMEVLACKSVEEKPKQIKNKMDKEKGFIKTLMASMAAYLSDDTKKPEIKAELTLQDSTGSEIIFPDLEEGATPAVGDKATIDGSAITDGSYIMPSDEGKTYTFEGGSITEIKEAEPEPDAKEEIKAEEIKEIVTYSAEAVSTSFNEGDVLTLKGWEDEEYTAGPGEWKLKNGSSVVTDAGGIIVKVKQANMPDPEPEAKIDEMIEKITKKVGAEISASYNKKVELQSEEISSLKKLIGSKELEIQAREDTPAQSIAGKGHDRAARILSKRKN